ncbi:sigma-54-dependent Fis family transcriptional regulator [Aneurinibacillus migulanus]|uniref:sigma-54-dependent Fis family transcriptional regulator n=1 Tax=Aneurinibacillus migulanus TaxID=47500 RepID=UPI00209F13C6|nr:sigma 54-interacting transcriptional regulator [Aneurinibacillus migulanus]MCP1358264.1 sigma 54-interacting transcriptional regulator [Aneurinibacillus migulanus]
MTRLLGIQPMVQLVADAISAALKVETEIVDEEMTVVAGTGKYREKINQKEEGGIREEGYLYGRVLMHNRWYVVENARQDPKYDPSVQNGNTEEFAEICCPIRQQGQAIGVIGLIAFTPEQRYQLMSNQENMLTFLFRMAELIESKISEMQAIHQLELATQNLETLIESVHEGILSIDPAGRITHCNRTAERLINRDKKQLIGQPLDSVWPGSPMLEVLTTGQGYQEKEEMYSSSSSHMHFIVNATPVTLNGRLMSVVASFRRMSDARRLAYSLTGGDAASSFAGIKGESDVIQVIKRQAAQVAQSHSSILITGESGTGKGLFAMAIHSHSPRNEGPFITVNCGAIPETLLESELFGYTRGAFTGANREGKAGKFELANGGTIFLDEIGDIPLHLQVKLLHVLQYKQVQRVGSEKSTPIDIRVIAATNRNLEQMVEDGEFRSDLYFRLNVIPLYIPPLRERKEDIPVLMQYFLHKHANLLGRNIVGYSPEAQELFQHYPWPGNVRELENAVEYAVNMETQPVIGKESVPQRVLPAETIECRSFSLKERIAQFERTVLEGMLKQYGTSVQAKRRIAEELDISLATLYRKLEETVFLKNEKSS